MPSAIQPLAPQRVAMLSATQPLGDGRLYGLVRLSVISFVCHG